MFTNILVTANNFNIYILSFLLFLQNNPHLLETLCKFRDIKNTILHNTYVLQIYNAIGNPSFSNLWFIGVTLIFNNTLIVCWLNPNFTLKFTYQIFIFQIFLSTWLFGLSISQMWMSPEIKPKSWNTKRWNWKTHCCFYIQK